jgi:hypothetical protein
MKMRTSDIEQGIAMPNLSKSTIQTNQQRELDKIENMCGLLGNTIRKTENFINRLTGDGFPSDDKATPEVMSYLGQLNLLYGMVNRMDELVNRLGDIG